MRADQEYGILLHLFESDRKQIIKFLKPLDKAHGTAEEIPGVRLLLWQLQHNTRIPHAIGDFATYLAEERSTRKR